MIAYCLLVYLDCKTPKCIAETNRRQHIYERQSAKRLKNLSDNFRYYVEMPVNIVTVENKPFATKSTCDNYFHGLDQSKEKLLTYKHICYTVSVKPGADCFGYHKITTSGV